MDQPTPLPINNSNTNSSSSNSNIQNHARYQGVHKHSRRHHHHHHPPRIGPPRAQTEEEEFLEAHNKVRIQLGLPPFEWDPEIAGYALMWANKRQFDCGMLHSYGPFGENLFWGLRHHWTPTDIVNSWISEAEFYDPTSNQCDPQRDCGHYTQVIWRDTIKVGCARITCGFGLGLLAVCSYDPPGNYEGENPLISYNDPPPDVPTDTTPE
ncbi:CAP domain-containing protein [Cephalotus follicularis]|uniref:CAP domain-containing protein n=1 Tax=Cephalotus follicularis TaxID=3775 RepID=A0A1Q3DCQ6_CEPFO|nr:CAP domain-containing protein [Cephalotus follicularis]